MLNIRHMRADIIRRISFKFQQSAVYKYDVDVSEKEYTELLCSVC